VRIEYELAGVASRIGAALIDMLLQLLAMGLVWLGWFSVLDLLKVSITSWVTGALIVVEFVIYWGYYMYFETVWNGQTPGKRYTRLRTVREGGLPINLACAAIRNLIRVLDSLLIGLVFMLATGRNQRLGDLAAGTMVVKERAEWAGELGRQGLGQPQPPHSVHPISPEAEVVRNIELVTTREYETVRRFLERMPELSEEVRERLAAKIAKPMMSRLGIEDSPSIRYTNLLVEIGRRCVEERGMR